MVPKETGGYQYQFYHKDHLGNIRQTFTGDPITTEFTATMETANATQEEADFSNVAETRQIDQAMAHNGSASARLNGSQNRTIGPAKSLAVGKGDQINLEVFARYNQATGNNQSLIGGLAAAVADGIWLNKWCK